MGKVRLSVLENFNISIYKTLRTYYRKGEMNVPAVEGQISINIVPPDGEAAKPKEN